MLDAAELLIRQSGGTDFSMRALAHAAEVSPATPYNFFGSKEGLLFELLTRSLNDFLKEALNYSSGDPLEQVIEAGEKAVGILIRDPIFLRPLYLILLGLSDPIHHPKFLKGAFVFYRATLESAAQHKLLKTENDRIALASSLMAYFIGILDLWVHEDIEDDWFRAQITYGFSNLLWPIASGQSLKVLQKRHDEAKKVLSKNRLRTSFTK